MAKIKFSEVFRKHSGRSVFYNKINRLVNTRLLSSITEQNKFYPPILVRQITH